MTGDHPLIAPGVALALWTVTSTAAGHNRPEDLFELDLATLLKVPVTLATRSEKSLIDSPSTVTLFTRDELDRLGVTDLEQLLDFIPGFSASRNGQDGLLTDIYSRGRLAGPGAVEILLLLDGQRLNGGRSGGALLNNARLPLNNIDRVEVIRGPASALYGSNAFNGVINLITARHLNDVRLTLGSFDHWELALNASGAAMGGQLAFFARGFGDRGDEFGLAAGGDTRDPKRGQDFHLGFQDEQWELTLRHANKAGDRFYLFEMANDDVNRTRLNQSSLQVQRHWQDSSGGRHSLAGDYWRANNDLSAQLLPAGALAEISEPASDAPLVIDAEFSADEYGLSWHYLGQGDVQPQWQWGASLRRSRTHSGTARSNFSLADLANNRQPVAALASDDASTVIQGPLARWIKSVYGQVDGRLLPGWQYTLGGRFDDYSDFGSKLSLRLGLVHHHDLANTFKLSYGEAFRAPSATETSLQNNPLFQGNPELAPELLESIEATWSHHGRDWLSTLTLFDRVNKAPVFVNMEGRPGARGVFFNGEQLTFSGAEWQWHGEITPHWQLRASISQLFRLPPSAARQARTSVAWSANYNRRRWNLNINGHFRDRRAAFAGTGGDTPSLPSHTVFNAHVQYQWQSNLRWSLHIDNLFDRRRRDPAQLGIITDGLPGRGRVMRMDVHYRFP